MNIKSPCIMCVQYIGGYAVHQEISSTSGVFITSRVLSTLEGTMSALGGGGGGIP